MRLENDEPIGFRAFDSREDWHRHRSMQVFHGVSKDGGGLTHFRCQAGPKCRCQQQGFSMSFQNRGVAFLPIPSTSLWEQILRNLGWVGCNGLFPAVYRFGMIGNVMIIYTPLTIDKTLQCSASKIDHVIPHFGARKNHPGDAEIGLGNDSCSMAEMVWMVSTCFYHGWQNWWHFIVHC